MTLTAKQVRTIDPLEWTLRGIRRDAGLFLRHALKLVEKMRDNVSTERLRAAPSDPSEAP